MPVGSGSGFLNSDILDPDPAKNGPDPQPWYDFLGVVPVPTRRVYDRHGCSRGLKDLLKTTVTDPNEF